MVDDIVITIMKADAINEAVEVISKSKILLSLILVGMLNSSK